MNRVSLERMARREQLIAQAAIERAALAQQINQLRIPIAIADQCLNIFCFVKKHRIWFTSGGLLLFVIKPVSHISLGKKMLRIGWLAFQALHKLRENNQRISPPASESNQLL